MRVRAPGGDVTFYSICYGLISLFFGKLMLDVGVLLIGLFFLFQFVCVLGLWFGFRKAIWGILPVLLVSFLVGTVKLVVGDLSLIAIWRPAFALVMFQAMYRWEPELMNHD